MKRTLIIMLVLIPIIFLVSCGSKPTENVDVDTTLEEAKDIVKKIYADEIIIIKPDNNFSPSDLESYLTENGYYEETIKKSVEYGNKIYAISNHIFMNIENNSKEEIKKNLLDDNWVKENKISDEAYTEDEFNDGLYVYEQIYR